ncbi:MAG TPA: methylated-DNA--[protein]-cysteine S-methyltransferase [Acidimicrobiales bacterium]
MTSPHRVVDSPVGPIGLSADSSGRLTGVHIGSHPDVEVTGHSDTGHTEAKERVFDETARQLEEYFEGVRKAFDLSLAMEGSPFQRRVWAELHTIAFGTTVTYAQLATRLGKAGAARAVGHANARNPIPIIVPCHRVIGSAGQLTGYGGGLEAKRLLLDLEAAASGTRTGAGTSVLGV